jgi:hypothetical protein
MKKSLRKILSVRLWAGVRLWKKIVPTRPRMSRKFRPFTARRCTEGKALSGGLWITFPRAHFPLGMTGEAVQNTPSPMSATRPAS